MNKRRVLTAVYILLIVVLVGAIYVGFSHHNKQKDTPGTSVAKTSPKLVDNSKAQSDANKKKVADSNKQTVTTPKPTTQSQSAPVSPAPTATAQTANGNLTNTGPGETIALFAGTFLVATVAYSLYQRKTLA